MNLTKKIFISNYLVVSILLNMNMQLWGSDTNLVTTETVMKAKRMIFLDFHNSAQSPNYNYLENTIGDQVHESLKKKYNYVLIEREVWEKYFASNKITNRSFYDPQLVLNMARALKADGLIMGKFTPDKQEQSIDIEAKIISVIDGETVAEKAVTSPIDQSLFEAIQTFSDFLGAKITDLFLPSDFGALKRSAIAPGWGQFYKQRPNWGYGWAISTGTLFLTSAYFTIAYASNYAAYNSAKPEDDPASLFDKAAANYQFMLIGWSVTAAVYIANLIDAYFFQGDYDVLRPQLTSNAAKINFAMSVREPHFLGKMRQAEQDLFFTLAWRKSI